MGMHFLGEITIGGPIPSELLPELVKLLDHAGVLPVRAREPRGETTVTGKIFSPLLLLLAKLSESELLHTIQYLEAENEMLRSRLPRAVKTTPAERSRLLKLAEPLGNAVTVRPAGPFISTR